MRKGAFMPTYECFHCRHRWAKGGGAQQCPRCGYEPGERGHRCIRPGWDGRMRQLGVMPAKQGGKEPTA